MRTEEGGKDAAKVTLACSTAQEKKAYADSEPHFLATERISTLDPRIELHCILGERTDVVCVFACIHVPAPYSFTRMTANRPIAHRPKYCHNSVLALREFASVQRVGRAGHFVRILVRESTHETLADEFRRLQALQENPDGLAACIANVLRGLASARSKL